MQGAEILMMKYRKAVMNAYIISVAALFSVRQPKPCLHHFNFGILDICRSFN